MVSWKSNVVKFRLYLLQGQMLMLQKNKDLFQDM